MKKFIAISAIAAIATMGFASEADIKAELEALKKEVEALKKAQEKINVKALKKQISALKAKTGGDNLKWNVDFRTAYDVIGYKYTNGKTDYNQILTNRLWLGMAYAPKDNIVFKGLLSYYKAYGQMTNTFGANFNYFDWIVNETPNPNGELRVKEAYWLYFGDNFLGADIPWTASFGRRPATDGLLASYREDQKPKSPLGHIINTEFDGASFKFNLENVTDVPGMYFKLCMGRGMTNANIRYASITPGFVYGSANTSRADLAISGSGSEYTKVDDFKSTDLAGFIFVPYDDGQYSVHTTAFKAWELPGIVFSGYMDLNGNNQHDPNEPSAGNFEQVGDMYGAAISLLAQGIGDGINDFLDDTNAFISFAWSKTDPKSDKQMLGMYVDTDGDNNPDTLLGADFGESKSGTSIYVGTNFPLDVIMDGARMGLEYNHGSRYWRSFTYAEDTLAGSKLAARGDAYEAWITKELIGKTLTAQLRYTYINYKYTGSNGFFANGGTPIKVEDAEDMGMTTVDKASDLRFYIRYRY
ncbi:DUF3373 family protein [Nitrosophilus kaiyonis]|uniref:DUF3373 family protein n=1 Tax=Nitrosophilus kaiyonis TaxID=2930200 RepID=UPI002492D9ED|nr:DUF3373 family protein [Nitrosophilus kaiyonis]